MDMGTPLGNRGRGSGSGFWICDRSLLTPDPRYLQPEWVHGLFACVDEDALHLGVVVEGLHAKLAAEAGLLVAAEGEAGEGGVGGVDCDNARLDLSGDAVGAADVPRPEGSGQAV